MRAGKPEDKVKYKKFNGKLKTQPSLFYFFLFYFLKESKKDPFRVHDNRKGKVFKVEEVEYSAHKNGWITECRLHT